MNASKLAHLRKEIISNSVTRLNRLGFPHVNETNILKDEVYKSYFLRILLEQIGKNTELDPLIRNLIIEIA